MPKASNQNSIKKSGEHSQYADRGWQPVSAALPDESELSLFVNGQEMIRILCTPEKLNCLVLGFLTTQGFTSDEGDISMIRICPDELIADVRLKGPAITPNRRVLTSGCGAGMSFDVPSSLSPIKSNCHFSPEQVLSSIRMLLQDNSEGRIDNRRGVHRSALIDGSSLLVVAEDIGRHNTIDKIWGECILRRIPPADRILVSTGRISSEMLIKAVKMGVPVVASMNSATNRAVELGVKLGVTVIGYARGSQFTAFCGEERIVSTQGG